MPSSKQRVLFVLLGSALAAIFFVHMFRSMAEGTRHPEYLHELENVRKTEIKGGPGKYMVGHDTLTGGAIAEPLGNETAKAELGRASWKLFHTVFARFPDKPTHDESLALESYVHLFARLYPCGECATHFQAILSKFPPQVTSRSTAAAWGCHVHNEVNKSLGKELFDCSNIGDFYDCGCADGDGDEKHDKVTRSKDKHSKRTHSKVAGREVNIDVD